MSALRQMSFATEYPLQCDICGQLISPGGFLHHRRRFEYHVLIFVQEGTLHLTAAGIKYEVLAGQYILLKAEEEHFGHQESTGPLILFLVFQFTEVFFRDGTNPFPTV